MRWHRTSDVGSNRSWVPLSSWWVSTSAPMRKPIYAATAASTGCKSVTCLTTASPERRHSSVSKPKCSPTALAPSCSSSSRCVPPDMTPSGRTPSGTIPPGGPAAPSVFGHPVVMCLATPRFQVLPGSNFLLNCMLLIRNAPDRGERGLLIDHRVCR